MSGCGVVGVTIGPTTYSWRSVPQMPHQRTSTRTSSAALISGTATSSMRMSDLSVEAGCAHGCLLGGRSSDRGLRRFESGTAGATLRPVLAHLAVDDGGGHDQRALEEVLPGLREVEEDHGVEDLDDQAGAEQGADEGAPAAQQARAAEHDGGDAAQRVADALCGVTDAQLGQQHDRAEEHEQGRSDVGEDDGAVDGTPTRRADSSSRPDGTQPQAPARQPQANSMAKATRRAGGRDRYGPDLS